MATLVYTCPSGDESVSQNKGNGNETPLCKNGQGLWADASTLNPPFWGGYSVDGNQAAQLLQVVIVTWVVAYVVRMVLDAIRGRR